MPKYDLNDVKAAEGFEQICSLERATINWILMKMNGYHDCVEIELRSQHLSPRSLWSAHIYTYFVFHINCDELINSSTRANNKEKKRRGKKLYVLNPCIQRTWHEHGIFVARHSLMMFDCVAMQCTIHLKFNVVSISKLRCHQKIELKRRENGREKKIHR